MASPYNGVVIHALFRHPDRLRRGGDRRLIAPIVALLMLAAKADGQSTQLLIGARFDIPLGVMVEAGRMWKRVDEPEGFGGPSLAVGIGTGGERVSFGTRYIVMMGLNAAGEVVVVHTARQPVTQIRDRWLIGAELRGGILLGNVGLGVLVPVTGQAALRGARLTASIGIGV